MKQKTTAWMEIPSPIFKTKFENTPTWVELNQTAQGNFLNFLARINDEQKILNYQKLFISDNHFDLALNRKYIELHISFDNQFLNLSEYYKCIDKENLLLHFRNIATELLDLNPDLLTVQLTYDESLLFIIKNHGNTIFYEIFINADDESNEKVVISVFGDSLIETGSFTLERSMEYLRDIVVPNNIGVSLVN